MQTLSTPRLMTPRLGDILVEQGTISCEQLKQGLELQTTTGQRLGNVLIGLGWADEEQVTEARSVQMDAVYVNMTRETSRTPSPSPWSPSRSPIATCSCRSP